MAFILGRDHLSLQCSIQGAFPPYRHIHIHQFNHANIDLLRTESQIPRRRQTPPTYIRQLLPLVNTKEPELADKIGLDTVTFLRFLRLFCYLFSIALPESSSYPYSQHNQSKLDYDILSVMTIRDVAGMDLTAHVVVEPFIVGLVMLFVYINRVQIVCL